MEKTVNVEVNRFKELLKGILISIICTILMLLTYSAILTYTSVSEETIPMVIIGITGVSILIGGVISSCKIKKQGIINGGILGLINMTLLYMISSIMNQNFSLEMESIVMIFVGIFFGMLGGIIGINKK